MFLNDLISAKKATFLALCEKFKVVNVYAFGSSVTDQFDVDSSDIDILVEVDYSDPLERGQALMDLWDELEHFFKRHVDLLTPSSIQNPIIKKEIETTKIRIYAGEKQEISF